jgi:coproporphyrinogen III oxidase-like Fe-S oxidoreductase
MSINLPNPISTNDAKSFFDKFFVNEISFPADAIDLTVAFFVKRGFDTESARSTAIVILNQAKVDNVNVFDLLNSLKTLTDVQLSQVVAQILNSYREKISLLGYRIAPLVNTYESRNILI